MNDIERDQLAFARELVKGDDPNLEPVAIDPWDDQVKFAKTQLAKENPVTKAQDAQYEKVRFSRVIATGERRLKHLVRKVDSWSGRLGGDSYMRAEVEFINAALAAIESQRGHSNKKSPILENIVKVYQSGDLGALDEALKEAEALGEVTS